MFYMPGSFTFSFSVFTFLFTNPNVLFALAVIELICSFQLRSLDRVTPRCLAVLVDSST